MDLFEYRSKVGADGALDLHVNLGSDQANRDVKITVQPLSTEMAQREWEDFVKRTAGSFDDPSFVRHEQGAFEDRGEIFR